MIFDTEAAILARLAANLAPGPMIYGTFDAVDMTDEAGAVLCSQLRLERVVASNEVHGSAAAVDLIYSFSVFVDVYRATSTTRSDAATLLQDAGDALVGWQYASFRTPQMIAGPETGFDGRILRIGIGFSIPAFFAGTN